MVSNEKVCKERFFILERRKITIARLRSGVNYKGPLDHILDSFYYLYQRFQLDHPEYNYGYYNFGYNKANRRDSKDMPGSDIIVIPSENEFHYHIIDKNGKSVYIDPKNLEKSSTAIKDHILPHIEGKHIVILRSDRGDTVELYKEKVFKNIDCKISVLDEIDIDGGVHALKYHFIRDEKLETVKRKYLFSYWGTEKRKDVDNVDSGDERHKILKEIQEGMGKFPTRFIGKFSLAKRNMKPTKGMRGLLPILNQSKYTLCFNWKDNKATTSRYHEALACGIIPMVYKDYDSTGILVKSNWQRVQSAEELYDKIMERDYEKTFNEIHETYKETLLTKDQIYDIFEKKFLEIIND